MVALVKEHLNYPIHDLVYRAGVSDSTISRFLLKWYSARSTRLTFLIHWPTREKLHATVPQRYHKSSGKRVAVIIDCIRRIYRPAIQPYGSGSDMEQLQAPYHHEISYWHCSPGSRVFHLKAVVWPRV